MNNHDGNLDFMFRDKLTEFQQALKTGSEEKILNCHRALQNLLPDTSESSLQDEYYKAKAWFIAETYADELTGEEWEFIGGAQLQDTSKPVTFKQRKWILNIAERLGIE